jgi:multiple sugar transport system substrate-binding protein
VGLWDAALTLYSTQSTLDEYGFRAATVEEPYTADELSEILETITASGDFNFAIDVESGTQGEWFAYAFAPLIQSAGGDLIDRSTFLTAEGVANGPEAVEAATWFQSLFIDGHASTNSGGGGLANGETAFHYSGSWNYGPLKEQFGDDLVVMPLPDMGNGPVIGAASWQWGVSASCEHPEAAADFIAMLMTPEKIAEASNATSLIPVSADALPMSDYYQEGQEARIFFEFADRFAMLRPETPGYPFISSTFERVFRDIMNGADVQSALDGYVDAVEINIADNQGYGFE